MEFIRYRPGAELNVAAPKDPVQAGGYVQGDENALMAPGRADTLALQVAPSTNLEAAKAALQETIAAKALRGLDYMSIPSEDGFDIQQALAPAMGRYNEDELRFLGDARSSAELAQRQQQVLSTRERGMAMAAHPVTAVAASLFDVDAVIGFGVGKAAGVARSVRAITALSANAAVLGVASQGGTISTLDVLGTSLGVAMSAIPRVQRAVRTAEGVATDAAPGAERAAADAVPTRMESVPDPDYTVPRPDTTFNRPHINIEADVQGNVRTSTQNMVRAIVGTADDLPEGVRVLGIALRDSLEKDAEIPVMLRNKSVQGTSEVRLLPDGSVRSTIFGSAEKDLDTSIRNMTTEQKAVALHEAAHAKTGLNIQAWYDGTLPAGPVKQAIDDIDRIRQQVDAATVNDAARLKDGPRKGIGYAVSNNHEFISQLFNDAGFREALKGIKVENRSVFSDLVRKVVQAFTGKADDSALSATVAAFETLLNESNNVAKFGTRPAPHMQSSILQAPDLQGVAAKSMRSINSGLALYDKIKGLGPKAATLADRLVVDATGSSSESAVHAARTAELAANVAAAQVDGAIRQAMRAQGWDTFSRVRSPKKYLQAQKEFSEKVYAALAENHKRYRAGDEILAHGDPEVQKVVDAFANSRWAEGNLERIKSSGMTGSEMIESSPYYLPRQHSASKVREFLAANPRVTREDVEGMYTSQFIKMFADRGIEQATANRLGKQMLRNMEQRADGNTGFRQAIVGMGEDDIEFALRSAGVGEDEIETFMTGIKNAQDGSNTARNLKRRVSFDMTADYKTKSGDLISPQLFVNKDVNQLMEGYSRNMAGRIGLAKAGFPDLRDVVRAVDEAAADAGDPRAAKETLDNTVNQILGYPTGENVPDILRSFSILSGASALANSGVFQIADAALLMKEFGITKTMKGLAKDAWGRKALEVAQSPEYGSRMRDILEARNVLSGRYRSVLTHLDDNTDVGSMGGFHQAVQQVGQYTRFANGMEFVRRSQVRVMAGLVGDSVDSAIKGDRAAAEQLRRFGLSDELLAQARAAYSADPDLRSWPTSIRFDMETMAQNMADQLVLENRLGEIPAWMQFSSLGKVILPYMTFVAGSWNKLARRTYAQEGVQGLAMMFAYQLPLTVLSTVAAMAVGGKELNAKDVTNQVVSNIPLMSWLGFGINMMSQGPTNSIAALGVVDKAYSAMSGIINGDASASQVVKAVPFVSIIPGLRAAAVALDED